MPASLCIHGHFYQPPREDPWLGEVLVEPSAAPMRNWNERITRESYAPLAWARRLDANGKIIELLNCYEWISFNAGPTLLRWMRRTFPNVLRRMVEGDAKSLARWGRGNAMAQIYHHQIMPLTREEDRTLVIRWAIDDFRHYFGREPEGMWLSECAADLPTLESLARQNIRFVILAPRQAKAVMVNGAAVPVNEGSLNVGEPYSIVLPSGKSITAIFYHGGLSQSIAFEGLLRSGESFWQRIVEAVSNLAGQTPGPRLLTLATDGETYGHHFTFGEMALAYVLAQGKQNKDGISLTNLPAYIAAHPPTREALIHEPSSWSCVHGIERWRSDCGCKDGGHPGWNQRWRGPLRDALNLARREVQKHFYSAGKTCLKDPGEALAAYGQVLAAPETAPDFAARWITGDKELHDKAWELLSMQEQSLASFASCAWFFDDIARLEPVNAMTFALRALETIKKTGGEDSVPAFANALDKAESNQIDCGSGKHIFETMVLSRPDDPAKLCLLAWLLLHAKGLTPAPGAPRSLAWQEFSVEFTDVTPLEDGKQEGSAAIKAANQHCGSRFFWRLSTPSLTKEEGNPFVSLAEAEIVVWPEEGPQMTAAHCKVRDFSLPLNDYLLSHYLENLEFAAGSTLQALAGHAASMFRSWQRLQHELTRPEFWIGFIPYLVLEYMQSEDFTEWQRTRIEDTVAEHLTKRGNSLANLLVRRSMLEALKQQADDALLASWARRVRRILPGMDWWDVQNAVWELGKTRYPQLSEKLDLE